LDKELDQKRISGRESWPDVADLESALCLKKKTERISTSEPLRKSKAARFCRPDSFAPGRRQCNRPAVIKCSTNQRSTSTSIDSLADPPQFAHGAGLYIRNWRLYGSKQKRARESNALIRPAHDTWFEGTDVGGDVRQFGHAYELAGRTRTFATLSYGFPDRIMLGIIRSCRFTPAPETPARRFCRRDKSDHVHPVPKRFSVRA
jgi:hypothetical protein